MCLAEILNKYYNIYKKGGGFREGVILVRVLFVSFFVFRELVLYIENWGPSVHIRPAQRILVCTRHHTNVL